MVGEIKIEEVDPAGKFIRLRNTSNERMRLAGYKLLHGDAKNPDRKIFYKFNRVLWLHAGVSTTVWSSGLRIVYDSPSTLVMKRGVVWPAMTTVDVVTTTLYQRGQVVQWMKFERGVFTRAINHDDVKIVQRSAAV